MFQEPRAEEQKQRRSVRPTHEAGGGGRQVPSGRSTNCSRWAISRGVNLNVLWGRMARERRIVPCRPVFGFSKSGLSLKTMFYLDNYDRDLNI